MQQPQPDYQHYGPNFPTVYPIELLIRQLPRHSYLPSRPVTFTKDEELYLRRVIAHDLKGFDRKTLKDLYMELTSFDKHLTGFIEYHDLSLVLSKYQVRISTQQLRLVAAQFVQPKFPGMADYEKVLSFIDSSLKENTTAESGSSTDRSDGSVTDRSGQLDPITYTPADVRSTTKFYHNNMKDSSALRAVVYNQLASSGKHIDFESAWQEFGQIDRLHRGTMSKQQIHELSSKCRISLQESVIDQIAQRCNAGFGQYNWVQYLQFLERVSPTKTSLDIFSERPDPSVRRSQPFSTSTPCQVETTSNRPEQKEDSTAAQNPTQGRARTAPPAGVPGGLAKIDNPQRLERIQQLQTQLQQLQLQHETDRTEMHRQQQARLEHPTPWIDRFLKLRQAFYFSDPNNTGYLNYFESKWLAQEFNRSWKLGIEENDINKALRWSLQGERVIIDAFLQRLVTMGPK